jgi:superfamily II DNA/RNA helicase
MTTHETTQYDLSNNLYNNNIKLYTEWDDLGLNEDVHRGVLAYGFEKPTNIQQKSIKPIIDGKDIIGQAQSGTGKTGSFTIGCLQRIDLSSSTTQAIILSNTHILAQQTYKVINSLSKYMDGLVTKLLIGGTSVSDDINDLRSRKPHIIVGTPGRVFDMMKRRHFDTVNIRLFIMDEADEMLNKGFKEQIYEIFRYLNDSVQVALFSATMPSEILTLTDKFLRNPVKITLNVEDVTLKGIKQFYIAVSNDQEKFDCLKDLYECISASQSIIYASSRERVTRLYDAMISDGFAVCSVHSEMPSSERDNTIEKFRNGQFRVMISSAMTTRGFDVQQVSTVIIFDMETFANNLENYVHAIGRSGRFGRKGLAINFMTKQDSTIFKAIEEKYKTNIQELPHNVSDYI